jgi:diguanylate cyclase (GGDEF)-like protein
VDSLLAPGLLTAGSFYALMVFYIASAIGFLSMVASRLGVELGASLRQREQEALSDALTDTLNRRGGQIEGDRLFAWSIRHDRKLAALLIDLDHFKQVNDTFGHAVGDAALVLLAQCLKAHLRPEDRLARIGGEEFLVLLPETGLDGALILAERLRQTIARTEVPAVAARVRVTASFGVAERAAGDRSMTEMLARADAALYRAKSSGRNRVVGPEATDTELAVGA